jgi:hypothetical protein
LHLRCRPWLRCSPWLRCIGSAKVVQRSRFNFMREAQIWYSRAPEQRPISVEFENVVVLSDDFYQEIVAHPVPNGLEGSESARRIASNPGPLHASAIAASRRKESSRYQSSASSARLINSAAWNTAGRGGSAPGANSGWTRFVPFGPSAGRELSRTATTSRSETQHRYVNGLTRQQQFGNVTCASVVLMKGQCTVRFDRYLR